MKPELKKELYQTVTAALIEQMEQGVAIWQKPWVISKAYQPQNGKSGRLYNGFNRIYLGYLQSEVFGSNDPRWFTFNNVKELDAKVKKGSKHTIVVFNAPVRYEKENSEGEVEAKTYWKTAYYKVYHASQCERLPEYDVESEAPVQPDGSEDYNMSVMVDWCNTNLSAIEHGGDRAYYSPLVDMIGMPSEDMFMRKSWYAQTLAHEIIHATGHESRLNRLDLSTFGSETYAKEELTAEFGAAMLCGMLDIPADMEQSAAYLKGWAAKCKDEPGLLIGAANAAEKATEFVMEDVYAIA